MDDARYDHQCTPRAMPQDLVGTETFRQGGPYPVGAEFVGLSDEITRDGPIGNEGEFNAIALMKQVEGAEDTGGWRFALLAFDGSAREIDPVQPRNCG